ncbi:MAG: viroplasmin family protein [Bacteroidales bacterium]
MAKKGQKYYVVWKGVEPGVYSNWADCQQQIKGFDGARYMAFPNEEQALQAYHGNMWDYLGKKQGQKKRPEVLRSGGPVWESLSVDAACSGNPGVMEYQCVNTKTGQRIFHGGPYPDATNNVGEFLAIVHCLALLKQKGKTIPVYTDSKTAMSWVKNKHAKTKLEPTPRNQKVFELIARAEKWLKTNTWDIPILKWDTENWGEIPADFGRK